MRIFHGIEAEGPWAGCSSLFVSDHTIQINELVFSLERARSLKIEQIYFGAGNNRKIPLNILENIPGLVKRYRIIFEVESPDQLDLIPKYLLKFINIVLCIPVKETLALSAVQSVKLLGKTKLSWIGPITPIITSLSDQRYKEDKEV